MRAQQTTDTLACGCKDRGDYRDTCAYHTAMNAEYYDAFREHRSVRPEREWWLGNAEGLI